MGTDRQSVSASVSENFSNRGSRKSAADPRRPKKAVEGWQAKPSTSGYYLAETI
jgi:hypothetical protein